MSRIYLVCLFLILGVSGVAHAWPWSSGGTPKAMKELSFDKTVEEAAGILGHIEPLPCGGGFERQTKQFGKLTCYRGPDRRTFAAGGGKIIHYKKDWMPLGGLNTLPQVNAIIPDDEIAPKYISRHDVKFDGFDSYNALWFFDGKILRISATCPPARIGDKLVPRKFRTCYINQLIASYAVESDFPEKMKKTELEF